MAESGSTAQAPAHMVRAQRDRILASEVFYRSKRQSQFLDYIVNASLDGREDKLKEQRIGIEVFGRDESFDPGIDSIVRVEASRLRGKIREYYSDVGQDDDVRIDIPKGHYLPVFTLNESQTERVRSLLALPVVAALGIAVVALALTVVDWSGPRETSPTTATLQEPDPYSVAVLPLRDWSSIPTEYFGEAMTDALISNLAEIPALRVTSFTSVRQFADTEVPIPDIARALGVSYVVEGSISRDSGKVQVAAKLIAGDTDESIWTATFERPIQDLLSMQREIAGALAQQISEELLPSLSSLGDMDPDAYDAYMKGRYFYNQFTADGFRRGIDYFQSAIELQPDYAEAYAALASCHCLLAGHGLELVSPVVAIPEAESLALTALDMNSGLAEPHAFLGIIDFKYGWDPVAAEQKISRAIALNPSLFQAYVWHSQILEAQGRNKEAVDRARYARQLNPLSLAAVLNYGWQLFQDGQYIQANSQIDKLIEFDPEFWGGHWARGHIFSQYESYEIAIDEFRLAVELGGGHSLPLSALGYAYALAGMPDEARGVIEDLKALSTETYVSPFHIATVYAGLDDTDQMFEWLERAYLVRARSLAWLQVTKEMQPYFDDPRFQDLLNRIGIHSIAMSDQAATIP